MALPVTQVLLSLLHSDDPNLPVPLLKALARLAADADCAKEIRQLGGLNVVISLLSTQGTSSTLQPQVTRHQPRRPRRARASLIMWPPQPPDVARQAIVAVCSVLTALALDDEAAMQACLWWRCQAHRERRAACSRRRATRAVCARRRSAKQMASICLGSCCSRHHGEARTTLTRRQTAATAARLPRSSETLRPGCCYAAASEITRARGARVAVATRASLRMPSARCASSSLRSVTASSSGDSSRLTCTPRSSTWGSMKEICRGAPSPDASASVARPLFTLHSSHSPVARLPRPPGTRRSCASSQRSLQRREQRCKRR